MKYMKNKKKNLQNDHIYDNYDLVAIEHGTVIAMLANNYKPDFIILPPYRAWCHRCEKGFMTLDDMTKHDREFHDYRRF